MASAGPGAVPGSLLGEARRGSSPTYGRLWTRRTPCHSVNFRTRAAPHHEVQPALGALGPSFPRFLRNLYPLGHQEMPIGNDKRTG